MTANSYQGKNILVMGYAVTGKSVVDYLVTKKANVRLNDRGDLSQDPSVNLLIEQGVEVVDKGHPLSVLDDIDLIVKNPGIPYSIEVLQTAMQRNIPIITDVEIAYQEAAAPIIGVTGSNGKTTTSSLIHHILEEKDDSTAWLAGNIGVPSLTTAQEAGADDRIIMELSSFQLMGIETFKPKIAVITNIYSAHLDYHKSREEYVKAKLKLMKNMTASDYLVYNADQEELKDWVKKCPAVKIPFSISKAPASTIKAQGAYYDQDFLYYKNERIAPLNAIQLPGEHNIANVLAAIAVAKIEKMPNNLIEKAIKSYLGMPHRIQPLGEINGISFYNDSKATNTTATITALNSFEDSLVYIGGGLDRGNDFKDLIPYLEKVKAAFLYGQSKDKMARDFEAAGVAVIKVFEDLSQAVQAAIKQAEEGDVVLFSPACASWDQYKNYELRGQEFIDLVERYTTHPKV